MAVSALALGSELFMVLMAHLVNELDQTYHPDVWPPVLCRVPMGWYVSHLREHDWQSRMRMGAVARRWARLRLRAIDKDLRMTGSAEGLCTPGVRLLFTMSRERRSDDNIITMTVVGP